jgi:hypothetical protein
MSIFIYIYIYVGICPHYGHDSGLIALLGKRKKRKKREIEGARHSTSSDRR